MNTTLATTQPAPTLTGQILRELWDQLPAHGGPSLQDLNWIRRSSQARAVRIYRSGPWRPSGEFPTYAQFRSWYLRQARLRTRYKEAVS